MKSIIRTCLIVSLLSSCAISVYAQTDEPANGSQDNQDVIEGIMQQADSESGELRDNSVFEDLAQLQKHPLDLNTCQIEDLKLLLETQVINDLQAQALLAYRAKNGNLIAIQELQAVPNWDLQTIKRVLPLVTVRGNIDDFNMPIGKMLTTGKNEIMGRVVGNSPTQLGYIPNPATGATHYLGSPYRFYTRFRHTYNTKVSYGITAEKDAGEPFASKSKFYGFDFYSAHLFFNNLNKTVKAVAIGDFEARFGQGLILWSGIATRKSADVMAIKRSARPLKQFSSVNEVAFLRGAGATLNLNSHFQTTIFASYRGVDANLPADTSGLGEDVTISSLQTSGLHRTAEEIKDKNAISLFNAGASLQYKNGGLRLGANAVYNQLSKVLTPSYQVYNQFDFKGTRLINASIDYSYLWQNLQFFGETAVSDNGGLATLNGLLMGIDRRVSVSALHRHYDRTYQTLRGNGFGESSGTNNEDGLFLGLQVRPSKQWLFNGYFDMYQFNWLRYQVSAPANGYDYLLQLNYRPSRGTDIYLRFKDEFKQADFKNNDTRFNTLTETHRSNLRLHITNKLTKELELRSRAEAVWLDNGSTKQQGYMVYQDVAWDPLSFPLQITGRFAIFNTDSYDTRVYTYENDILYSYSAPTYYYKGTRWYLNLRYRPTKNLTTELRVAQTYLDNKTTIGTAYDQYPSNTRTEVKAQIRLTF